jgi:hypothetical protein
VRALVLVFAVLALAGAGCRDEAAEADPAASSTEPLSSSELGWVRAYSAWTIEISEDADGSESGAAAAASCRRDLETVGEPPTERLEPAARNLPEVCSSLAHQGWRRHALDLIQDADDAVYALFLDDQPLELGTGERTASYADVELSRRATQWLERPVEVRCWTDDDWRRYFAEEDAWNDDTTDFDDYVGWSDDDLDRIHLVLAYCNTITRVMSDDVSTWSRDVQVDAIDAVETLAHEIQHFALPDADEAKVECSAIRMLPRFAQRFGMDPATARALTDLYRTEVYPDLDEEYTKGGCAP